MLRNSLISRTKKVLWGALFAPNRDPDKWPVPSSFSALRAFGVRSGLDAISQAMSEGVHSADVVINILARQREPPPPAAIATPAGLHLVHSPTADCTRYDSIRRAV